MLYTYSHLAHYTILGKKIQGVYRKMPQKNPFSAVICEFDPLHHGHRLLLEQAGRFGSPVFCIMSGNFVQRGAPAMLDKWTRARLALLNGADLVIELPLTWACAGAERFASGGVALAAALGGGQLFFGSEVPDVELLQQIAEALISPEFSRALSAGDSGQSFAARRQQAVARLLGPAAGEVLGCPNANLGIEYCKAIRQQHASLTPVAIRREGAAHDEDEPHTNNLTGDTVPLSASALRKLTFSGQSLVGLAPESTVRAIETARREGRCAHIQYLERAILCKLRAMNQPELSLLPDLSEGLENRLYQAVRHARTLDELYTLVKSKRISHARVRRLVLSAFLGLRHPLPSAPPYLRILGATPKGWRALSGLAPALPVAARSHDIERLSPEAQAAFRLEARADDLYALSTPTPQPSGRDYTEKLVKP